MNFSLLLYEGALHGALTLMCVTRNCVLCNGDQKSSWSLSD